VEPVELLGHGVRRACARALVVSLGGGALALGAQRLGALGPVALAFPALFALVVVAPATWLEVRAQERPGQPSRGLVGVACAPPLLAGLAVLQFVYLELVISRGPQQALLALGDAVGRGLGDGVVLGVILGLPVSVAACRRAALVPFGRTALWNLALSLALCGIWVPCMVLWLLVEAGSELGDWLERAWTGARAPRGALRGLPPSRVWLLAYLGHPEAVRLLGARAPLAPDGLVEWLRGLESAGSEAMMRAPVAPVRRVLREGPLAPGWEAARAALEAWSDAPTPAAAQAVCQALLAAPAPEGGREVGLRMLVGVLRPEPWGRATSLARAVPALGEPESLREEIGAELRAWALEGTPGPSPG
jgi:hypothetical protein